VLDRKFNGGKNRSNWPYFRPVSSQYVFALHYKTLAYTWCYPTFYIIYSLMLETIEAHYAFVSHQDPDITPVDVLSK